MMTSEKPQVDYRAAYSLQGVYVVTWRKGGRTKTVERWMNSADELVSLLDGWIERGYSIVHVSYRGK
jgi:hypothetical protein